MIYLLEPRIGYGGGGLSYVRMAKWFNDNYIPSCICYETIDEQLLQEIKEKKIRFKQIHSKSVYNLVKEAKKSDKVLCFNPREYLLATVLFRRTNWILYVQHPLAFDINRLQNYPSIQKTARKLLKPFIWNGIKKHTIVFMNKGCGNHLNEAYKTKLFNNDDCVIGLSYSVDIEKGLSIDEFRRRYENNMILAIARADFPFKGYLLGLIDEFHKIIERFPTVNLVIVSFGHQEMLLRERVLLLPESERNRIKIIGKTPYNELEKYYRNARVYIGMGSTVIEASKYGVPAIVAKAYENELFLSKEIASRDIDMGATDAMNFDKSLKPLFSLLELEWDEYYGECCKAKEAFVGAHDENIVMNRMVKWCNLI